MVDLVYSRFSLTVRVYSQYLPWGENRPYNDGDEYNCMVIKSQMRDTGHPHFQEEEVVVVDEVSGADL